MFTPDLLRQLANTLCSLLELTASLNLFLVHSERKSKVKPHWAVWLQRGLVSGA